MKRTKGLAGAPLALLITAPLHADQALIPLGQLMGRAEAILIGRVSETRPASPPACHARRSRVRARRPHRIASQ
jgi:hypothetical protein